MHSRISWMSCLCFWALSGFMASAMGADASGRWIAAADGDQIEMEFSVQGTTLTGRIHNAGLGAADIQDGMVRGDEISFVVPRKIDLSVFKTVWKGRIAGDEIRFTSEFAGASREIIARRVTPVEAPAAKPKISLDPAAIEGKWLAIVDRNMVVMQFAVKENVLTGTLDHAVNGLAEIQEGTVDGDTIAFVVKRTFGANATVINWKGQVVGDEIRFVRTIGNVVTRIVARRVKPVSNPGKHLAL